MTTEDEYRTHRPKRVNKALERLRRHEIVSITPVVAAFGGANGYGWSVDHDYTALIVYRADAELLP